MKTLKKNELKEILIKNWMTHDAMWFYHCLQECGIERTNKINKAAIRSMAAIEIKRIQKAVDIDNVETFEDLKSLVDAAFDVLKGDFMDFAYNGVKQLSVLDRYQCGIMERVCGWFDGVGIKYSVSPPMEGCMMHTDGKCFRDFTFNFDK
jgi:hypothetical protein